MPRSGTPTPVPMAGPCAVAPGTAVVAIAPGLAAPVMGASVANDSPAGCPAGAAGALTSTAAGLLARPDVVAWRSTLPATSAACGASGRPVATRIAFGAGVVISGAVFSDDGRFGPTTSD